MADKGTGIGRRIIVTGLAGSGKSTFSRALGAKTGLPVLHLDLLFWQPGWQAPTPEEWCATQERLLAGEAWIADGNYHETLELRLKRADTVVMLDTPWPVCFGRALRRSVRNSGGEMPEGCPDSAWRRLRGELPVAGRIWRKRHWEPELERQIVATHGKHTAVHVLQSPEASAAFLDQIDGTLGTAPG